MVGRSRQQNWAKVATEPKQAMLDAAKFDPAAANILQVIPMGRTAALQWRADAKLMSSRALRPQKDGTVNLLGLSPSMELTFYSAGVDRSLVVMFDPWCQPRTFPCDGEITHASGPLPEKFADLSDAVAQARKDGFRQHIGNAILSCHQKRNYAFHCAWVLAGDRQLADDDDNVYCFDAVERQAFLQAEIEATAGSFGEGNAADEHWCRAGRTTHTILHPPLVWQFLNLDVPVPGEPHPWQVSIPIRPYGDQERTDLLTMTPGGDVTVRPGVTIHSGPFRCLTMEERRIFRQVFKDSTLEIGVPPYLVLCQRAAAKDTSAAAKATARLELERRYDAP